MHIFLHRNTEIYLMFLVYCWISIWKNRYPVLASLAEGPQSWNCERTLDKGGRNERACFHALRLSNIIDIWLWTVVFFFFLMTRVRRRLDPSDLTFFANPGEAQGNHHLDFPLFSRIFNNKFWTQNLRITPKPQIQSLSLDHALVVVFLLLGGWLSYEVSWKVWL